VAEQMDDETRLPAELARFESAVPDSVQHPALCVSFELWLAGAETGIPEPNPPLHKEVEDRLDEE
jgi:hypothetical protein